MLTLKDDTMLGDVPDGWDVKPLRRLVTADYPGDWGEERGPSMTRVLRSTNLTNDGHLDLDDVALRALPADKIAPLAPRRGDILLERSGGGPGQPVGRVGLVTLDMPGYAFSNFLHLLRPDPDEIDPRFLKWVLYQVNRTGRVVRLEQQTTQMRNLHFRDYLTMPVPVPPPHEQTAIARILDAVDNALERTRAAVERARELRFSVIHEALSRGTANEAPRRSPAGLIPASWSAEALGGHLAEGPTNGVYRPESDYAAHGTRIIRIDDFEQGRFKNFDELRRVVVEPVIAKRYAVAPNDVLINRVNSMSHIGKATLVPPLTETTIFESNMMRLRCGPRLLPAFLNTVLCSEIARRHWLARAKPAVNQASINQRDVRELLVPIPRRPAEQADIVALVAAAERRIDALSAVLAAQRALKAALMHDLLTGLVRVRDAGKVAAS